MLTRMTEDDWTITLQVFAAAQSRRGQQGRNDRKFLEALHLFTVHDLSWRALPATFGAWNCIWKRFWRLSQTGVFEAFFQLLAETSPTAHLVQMRHGAVVRAHVSAAGGKGGQKNQALGRMTSSSPSTEPTSRTRHDSEANPRQLSGWASRTTSCRSDRRSLTVPTQNGAIGPVLFFNF
jgi:transposase